MTHEPKTRAERIEDARNHPLVKNWERNHRGKVYRDAGATEAVLRVLDALALPPDPPRGDGWDALRELRSRLTKMRQRSAEDYGDDDGSVEQLECIDAMIRRLLTAAPKPEPAESPASMDHDWGLPHGPVTWDHCHRCGIIKRADGKNSKVCKGAPRIGPRRDTP